MKEKNLLVSGAIVFKKSGGKITWFIVRQGKEAGWEIPKTNVRKGESSVRAALRLTSEQGGIRAKVLEEVGRAGGVATINGNVVPLRYLYYLMVHKDSSDEALGFSESEWLDYKTASRRLSSKRERLMLKEAKQMVEKLEKAKN